jgi:hypothetical protein
MSYSLIPYAVDLKKLRAAVGSKEQALVQAVIHGNAKLFKQQGEAGELSLREALEQLVMGSDLDGDWGHVYGYALEQLCRHLGTPLKVEGWIGVHWEIMEMFQLDQLLKDSGPPVELPFIADFPTIGHIRAKDLPRVLRDVQERKADATDADLRGLLGELEGWLKKARAGAKDLVLFYY